MCVPGRSVPQAHAAQKKKAFIDFAPFWILIEFGGIA